MDEEKDIKTMVQEMHNALIGDKYRKEGIVHKVDSHEKRITRIEKYVVGASAIGAFIFLIVKIGGEFISIFK